MKGYQKLAIFLVVLLFSVGMMSVAIDILGDITEVEFNTGTRLVPGVDTGTEKGDEETKLTQAVEVEGGSTGGERVLFEIVYPPGTRYLRTTVGAGYVNGTWEPFEVGGWTGYNGEVLEPEPSGVALGESFFFTVRPVSMKIRNMPGTLYTMRVGGLEEMEYNRHLELFSSVEPFNRTYSIEHTVYRFTDRTLTNSEVTSFDDYLTISDDLQESLENLANNIVGDIPTDYYKLKAIEDYLKNNYEYNPNYERAPNYTDPVEWFLFEEEKGVCSQFNTAFVLLARSLGIATRPVAGYQIKPESNYQFVLRRDSHLWAEAHFEDVGWITFDATPPIEQEADKKVKIFETTTNITFNDPIALKGNKFQVHGTVELSNGTGVSGLTVEIFLTLKKNETDAPCGTGVVQQGFFNISCDADPSLEVGDYNLIAHTLPSGSYGESWSDPPIKIITDTNVTIQAPVSAYVGDRVSIHGTLLDKSNGQPIANATLSIQVGNETKSLRTDNNGDIHLSYTFEIEDNTTIGVVMDETEYYLGSESSFGIAIKMRPAPKPSIFMIITTFPYNVIIFAGFVLVIGSVLVYTRKQEDKPQPRVEVEIEEEIPRGFKDYKDGIVRLFNWFYARSRIRLEGIDDSLTPREFQDKVLPWIPEKGSPALEYLVTAFEIADYSASNPSQEMYEKSLTAVELLGEMIDHGS